DYNRLNADASTTPEVWQSSAGSIDVQFCLAKYDPDGNETSGIEYVTTTNSSFDYSSDSVKFTDKGGADAWPNKNYLNIWVCNLADNVLGYATLPSGNTLDKTDGVVIRYKSFGRGGTALAPYNKGRTATHEVGHWLGLVHTFGGCSDVDDCSDTPPEDQPVYGCPSFPLIDACNNTPNGVMFMNYMDYTDDGCMNIFTICQDNIMTGVLNTFRKDLKTSPAGCQGISFSNDASVSVIINPVDTLVTQGFIPEVQVSNRGLNTIEFVKIGYQVDGQEPAYFDTTLSLASSLSTPIKLPVYFTGEGGHVFYAWSQEPNHTTDEFIYNDTSEAAFFVRSTVPKNSSLTFANETGNMISFKISNPSAGTMQFQIVNIIGQIMLSGNVPVYDSATFTIDMKSYANGIYFLYGKIGYDYVKEKFMVIRP
ncbi:MAG: hypothetical protein LH473_03605, partial [Chitinophagales bacterium]|nr:hypothetical protein [Chitinophagales bacterium]